MAQEIIIRRAGLHDLPKIRLGPFALAICAKAASNWPESARARTTARSTDHPGLSPFVFPLLGHERFGKAGIDRFQLAKCVSTRATRPSDFLPSNSTAVSCMGLGRIRITLMQLCLGVEQRNRPGIRFRGALDRIADDADASTSLRARNFSASDGRDVA